MPEQIRKIIDKVLEWWKKFNTKQRTLIISITAVVVVALVILAYVASRPTMVQLIACEDASQASEVKNILEDAGISYQIDNSLVYMVDSSDEVNAEMALAQGDIPAQSYDISNVTDGSFSTTEADKQKKYQVYLEGKFTDHLKQLDFVKNASVDIDLPSNDGTIISKDEEGSAAITLDLKDSISEDQAYAIARLVSTQLGNDTTAGVTIIDTKGNILYSGTDTETSAGLASSQLSYKDKLENQVKDEIVQTLEDSNVFSNIQVGMNLNVDFTTSETAEKNYSYPDGLDHSLTESESLYESNATNGDAAVPGTDANDGNTYTTQDNAYSESSITDNDYNYLNDEKITTTQNNGGNIDYDNSSVSVVATRYVVYDQAAMEANGDLKNTTWDQFKLDNADPVKVTDVDQDFISMVATATGFDADNITFLVYEQAEFVDKSGMNISYSDIFQIALAVLIFALLAFVVFRSTRTAKEVEPEAELSVESLLDATSDEEALDDIGYAEKSETRILIEKFVDENPDAVALLLRNWLNEDWE